MHNDNVLRQKLKRKYGDEQVFVVPYAMTRIIPDKFSAPRGKIPNELATWDTKGRYMFRCDAEYNPAVQQLIPYAFLTNAREDKYYVAQRLGGDERLMSCLSLGFGGHINPVDGANNVITNALNRELNEELHLTALKNESSHLFGYVRDLQSDTKDHLGVVFMLKVRFARIREKEVLEGKWMNKNELFEKYHLFESWSKYIIDHLYMTHGLTISV